jgi:hypothetical protein
MEPIWVEQEHAHQAWRIIHLFYRAFGEFARQHAAYDAEVERLAAERGIARENLRLQASELGNLFDFKSFEVLRDQTLFELKNLCHQVFRGQNATDPLDRFVSDIFHEISILKEEHYTVKMYATAYQEAQDVEPLQSILDDAHEIFPRKVQQVDRLFLRAREVMERYLASFAKYPIVLRSLFLERHGFVAAAYADGVREFFRWMYPCGPIEGFYRVARSFEGGGFIGEAREGYGLAIREREDAIEYVAHPERYRRGVRAAAANAGPEIRNGPGRWTLPTLERVERFARLARSRRAVLARSSVSGAEPCVGADPMNDTRAHGEPQTPDRPVAPSRPFDDGEARGDIEAVASPRRAPSRARSGAVIPPRISSGGGAIESGAIGYDAIPRDFERDTRRET